MPLATLSIDFVARLAALEQGMTQATRLAQQNADRISSAYDGINSTIRKLGATIATYLSIDAFKTLITGAIDAQDHLNDLSKRAQVAVLDIGGIGFASQQAGGSADDAALSLGKLNLTIAKAAGGNKEAVALFQRLGVSFRDDVTGQARSATVVLADLATKFSSWNEGPEKAALGNALFGKSYAGILPLLEDGGAKLQQNIAFFERYSGVTAATAKAADEFNDSLTKLHLLQGAFANNLAAAVLPTLQALVDRFTESKEKGDGFATTAALIGDALRGVATIAAFVVESLSVMSTRLDGLVQKAQTILAADAEIADKLKNFQVGDALGVIGHTKQVFTGIKQQVEADIAAAQKRYDDFVARLSAGGDPFAGLDHSHTDRLKTGAPNAPQPATHDRTTEIERLIARLNEQTLAELTAGDSTKALEKAQLELATNPKLATATAAQRQQFLDLAAGLDKLKDKFSQAGQDAAENDRLLGEGLAELAKQSDAQARAFEQLSASTPTNQLEATRLEMQRLADLFNTGVISADRFSELAATKLGILPAQFERVTSRMEELAVDAAKTINEALGDTITDVLEGKFSSIGADFEKLLVRMAASALQADIGNLLFGKDFGKGGGLGGLITTIFPSLAGFGGKAGGGSVAPFSINRVNENGPEGLTIQGKDYLMNGGQWGKVTPAGRGQASPTFVFQIAAGVTRNELAALIPALKAQIKGELVQSMRRPGFSGA